MSYNKIIEDLFNKLNISFKEINIIKDYSEIDKSYKKSLKVNQYDKNGKYIQTFNSITEAMKKTGAKKIIDVCKGRRKMSGGYIWKYFND